MGDAEQGKKDVHCGLDGIMVGLKEIRRPSNELGSVMMRVRYPMLLASFLVGYPAAPSDPHEFSLTMQPVARALLMFKVVFSLVWAGQPEA